MSRTIATATLRSPVGATSVDAGAATDGSRPPLWARLWLSADAAQRRSTRDGIEIASMHDGRHTLVSAVVREARGLDGDAFRQRSLDVYRQIRGITDETANPHIVRMWNHIPGIHDPLDGECDRYMHFNAGRFAAMCEWFGDADAIPASVPAASGVGHDGRDLFVHALAVAEPGAPIENPQQVPAFRYSRRYGPLPPCFARATLVIRPTRTLLIAGTAAITGEQSQHLYDLAGQLELTLDNLRTLIRCGAADEADSLDPLRRMRHVRVYHVRSDDLPAIRQRCHSVFAGAENQVEYVPASLCRAELLVEIEGIARLD